jgi:hypothetical protein
VTADPIPDAWIDAALVADVLWMRQARAIVFVSPSRDQVRMMLEAAAPLIAAAERERIRKKADDECDEKLYAAISDLFEELEHG